MVLCSVRNPAVIRDSIITDSPRTFRMLRKSFENLSTRKLDVVFLQILYLFTKCNKKVKGVKQGICAPRSGIMHFE